MGKGKGSKNLEFCKIKKNSLFCEVWNLLPCYYDIFKKKVKYYVGFRCNILTLNTPLFKNLQIPLVLRYLSHRLKSQKWPGRNTVFNRN